MKDVTFRIAMVTMAVALIAPLAQAQGTAKSLSGGAGTGSIMTREELRACLKQQTTLAARRDQLEQDRATLEKDRAAILAENDALNKEKGQIGQDGGVVAAINARQKALSDRIADWNARMQAFEKENRSGPFADRERRRLVAEQKEIEAENRALEGNRTDLGSASPESVKAYNERAAAQEKRTIEWNARNQRLAEVSQKLADDREFWGAECGNRRYRRGRRDRDPQWPVTPTRCCRTGARRSACHPSPTSSRRTSGRPSRRPCRRTAPS